ARDVGARELHLEVGVTGAAGPRRPAAGDRTGGVGVGEGDVVDVDAQRAGCVVMPTHRAVELLERDDVAQLRRQLDRAVARGELQRALRLVAVERARDPADAGPRVVGDPADV